MRNSNKYITHIKPQSFIQEVWKYISPYKYTFIIDFDSVPVAVNTQHHSQIVKLLLYHNDVLVKYEEVYGKHVIIDILYFLHLHFFSYINDCFEEKQLEIYYISEEHAKHDFTRVIEYLIQQGSFSV
jgi:hypothetical protein